MLEQEKVVGITSYERLSVFWLVLPAWMGSHGLKDFFFELGLLHIGWVKSCWDRVEGVGVESEVCYVM